jgi:DNA uptake protein ComE-like DNA-binding protein
MRTTSWNRLIAAAALAVLVFAAPAAAWQKKTPPPAAKAKPDINWATQVELEKLPGLTRPLAKKIIANRPYRSVDDLARVGVPKDTIEKLRPQVTSEELGPDHRPQRIMRSKARPPK